MAENEPTTSELNTKARQGIKLLMGRQVCLQIVTFAGGVVLARTLGPGPLGLYIIANFLVSLFMLVGDFGLAPSLIQRKNDITDRELQVGFTLQQILTTIIVLLLFVCAPLLAHLYPKAPPETVWLVRALAVNLYFMSWRTMSALQLERHLKYDKLAKIEVLEALIYQGTAVGMAVAHFGTWSFVIAVLASGIIGSLLVYLASPWKIRFAYDREIAREILRFGVPFQLQTITNSVGGWVTPLLVGSIIGPAGVGYLTWASSNGKKPLIIVDNVMRVSFPHFSRLQDDLDEVERVMIRYMNLLLIPAGLWFSVILVAGDPLVEWIYTDKWVHAVPLLRIYSFILLADVISMILIVTLNSMGQVTKTLKIFSIKSVINIILSISFVLLFGIIGIPIAFLLTTVGGMIYFLKCFGNPAAKRIAAANCWILFPIIISCGLGSTIRYLALSNMVHALLSTALVTLVYLIVAYLCAPDRIKRSLDHRLPAVIRKSFSPI